MNTLILWFWLFIAGGEFGIAALYYARGNPWIALTMLCYAIASVAIYMEGER